MSPAALLLDLGKVNIAASVLIGLVMVLRKPVRSLFGARVAYGLWLLPPLAGLATLLPARTGPTVVEQARTVAPSADLGALAAAAPMVMPAHPSLDLAPIAAEVWLGGIVLFLAWLGLRQIRFAAAARQGRAGPAVAGLLHPRIITPADFDSRYDAEERAVVLAHERTHLARQDPRIVALAVLLQGVNWFNPLVHLAVRQLRIDQELACDAEVMALLVGVKRTYAQAMLKTQMAAETPLPLGCLWPAAGRHPLTERIALLTAVRPSRAKRRAGGIVVAALSLAAAAGAWAAIPARPGEVVIEPAVVATHASTARHVHRVRKAVNTEAPSSIRPIPAVAIAAPADAQPVEPVSDPAPAPALTPIAFVTAAGLAADPDPAPMVEDADWVHKPDRSEIMRAFPFHAITWNRQGEVMLRCTVQVTGVVTDCTVLSSTGNDHLFPQAALQLSRSFRLRPRMVDGVPEASPVRIPVKFEAHACLNLGCIYGQKG